MVTSVLDASAVIAWLKDEPGAALVDLALEGVGRAVISTVNLAEVMSFAAQAGQQTEEIMGLLRETGLAFLPLSTTQARRIGDLRPLTASAGLSLGDRACLALGQELGAQVLTPDRVWADLELSGLMVKLLR